MLGFVLGLVPDWVRRKRALKTHWELLAVEILLCSHRARTYLTHNVLSPLYRLPLVAFGASFPVLASEADMKPDEFFRLSEYYSCAADINRGLDQAASQISDGPSLSAEANRLQIKCSDFLGKYLQPAIAVVESRLGRSLDVKSPAAPSQD